ncbi:acyltransferase family protein [Tardiphaga sp. 803_E3_N1_3]|uniref:acyltransferase family protein n=1 Tax=Tardiphaga sp. 803_E3_N1_3 TaxID=3240785 RepID=UPI003F222B62
MKLPITSPLLPAGYRPDIDGLRAVAVLAVVFFHAFPNEVPGGYVGVDVFFVISGFLITSILLRENSDGQFSLASFYGRRVRRIFPALAVCLTAVLAFGFLCLMPSELAQVGKHIFFGASFSSNIATWSEIGYFDIAATLKPLLHLWSLGVEEQFYILWPILIWMSFRNGARVGLVLTVLFLAAFALNVALSSTNSDAFFLPMPRFWEFLAGAALALRRDVALAPVVRSWISVVGLAALLTSVAMFTPELRFPGWAALLPVAGASMIILAGPRALANRYVLAHRAIVFVGLISYPLYLWHWPLISYSYIIRVGKAPTSLMAVALVVASFLLAWSTYYFVERPIRFGAHRRWYIQAATISMVVIGASGLLVWTNNGFPARFPSLPGIDMRKIAEARRDPIFAPTRSMDVTKHGNILVAHIGKGDRKVAFSGDSMMFQYGPRVQRLFDGGALSANTYFVVGGSCPPVPGAIHSSDWLADCSNMPEILSRLVKREGIQSVVLGAGWAGYGGDRLLIDRAGKLSPLGTNNILDAFYANLEDYVRLLQAQGAEVHIVLGAPTDPQRFSPREMVIRSPFGFQINPNVEQTVQVADLRAVNSITDAKLREIADRTGAKLLDPFPDVCGDGEECSPFFGAVEPKYSDGVHLRPDFVQDRIQFLDPLLD